MPMEMLDLKKVNPKQDQTIHDGQNLTFKDAKKGGMFLSWHALEYPHSHRRPEWFLTLAVVTIALVITALVFRNYFFAFFLAVAGALIGWFAMRAPKFISFAITNEGVMIDRRFHEFKELKSFWIFYDPPLFDEISIISKKTIMPRIVIPLGGTPQEKVRGILRRFLPEEKQEESLITLVSRVLGF